MQTRGIVSGVLVAVMTVLSGLSADRIAIPDNTFVTYMSPKDSIMNQVVKQAFEKTEGKHVQYIELSTGNHYAINDWNPVSAPHQVGRCIWIDVYLPALHAITDWDPVQHHTSMEQAW